jgi:RNA polymerase nonessential primary-like sigma factor
MARRWTAEEELETARAMREAEARALELVRPFSEAKDALVKTSSRSEKTVAAHVDRLEAAVEAVYKAYRTHPTHGKTARQARSYVQVAREHRWNLAMSAKRIPRAEAKKHSLTEEDREDLYHVGIIGLMDAAKRFDPERGFRFTTYAAWWVRARMTRAITPYAVVMPPHLNEKRMRIRKAKRMLESMGSDWTMQDLVDESGMREEVIRKVLSVPMTTVYLDQSIDDDAMPGRETRLVEQMEDETLRDTDDVLSDHANEQWLTEALERLDPRERVIIEHFYGLQTGDSMSLSEAGRQIGISRERARQICASAIGKLQIIARRERRSHIIEQDSERKDPSRIFREDVLDAIDGTPMKIQDICTKICGDYTGKIRQRVYSHLARMRSEGIVVQEGSSRSATWRRIQIEVAE